MKKVKANILNIFNEKITLKGYVSYEDLSNANDFKVKFYEEEEDKDFFLIAKKELIF